MRKTQRKIVPLKDLTLLEQIETEKELRTSPELRAVRMDVYAMDTEGIIYNSEMQKQYKHDLPKRSRYYQDLIDICNKF